MKIKKLILPILVCNFLFAMGQFKQTPLKFKYNALEPYIDSTTMYIHYNNHHATYVSNLNKALEKYPELYKKPIVELLQNLDKLPADIQLVVRNSGGGHYNHDLFWTFLAPAGSTKISANLEKALIANFGSVDAFRAEFEKAAATRFGAGWAWLIKEPSGKLRICSTANQDNSYMPDAIVKGKPVLALDVWEHAYYLKYQSKRASYIKAFWQVVNWEEVDRLLSE